MGGFTRKLQAAPPGQVPAEPGGGPARGGDAAQGRRVPGQVPSCRSRGNTGRGRAWPQQAGPWGAIALNRGAGARALEPQVALLWLALGSPQAPVFPPLVSGCWAAASGKRQRASPARCPVRTHTETRLRVEDGHGDGAVGAEGPIPQRGLLQGRLVPRVSDTRPVAGEEPPLGQGLQECTSECPGGRPVLPGAGRGPLGGSRRGAPAAGAGLCVRKPTRPCTCEGHALLCSPSTQSERDPPRPRQQVGQLRVGSPTAASSSAGNRAPRAGAALTRGRVLLGLTNTCVCYGLDFRGPPNPCAEA